MAASFSVNGIVLRSFKLGEADKIITLYSEQAGKVSVLAKGVRRQKSRFGAVVDPFTDLRITAHKGKGTLPILVQAEVKRPYLTVRADWESLRYGYAMLEAVDKYGQEQQEEPRLYRLLRAGLSALAASADRNRILLMFDIKLAAVAGFLPNLFSCCVCAKGATAISHFSVSQGGAVCGRCLPQAPDAARLSRDVPALAWQLLYTPFDELSSVEARPRSEMALREIMATHLNYHAQTRLPTRGMLLGGPARAGGIRAGS